MNSPWTKEELALILDLYFFLEKEAIHCRDPRLTKLSEVLNHLPLREGVPLDTLRLRTPHEVWLKLYGCRTIDPHYRDPCQIPVSQPDTSTFSKFTGDVKRIVSRARRIRKVTEDNTVRAGLYGIKNGAEAATQTDKAESSFTLHQYLERTSNYSIWEKKLRVLSEYGGFACEVCGLDFMQRYGPRGFGYVEGHHRTPLAELSTETETTVEDLALVCANCHQMLHRSGILTLAELGKKMRA